MDFHSLFPQSILASTYTSLPILLFCKKSDVVSISWHGQMEGAMIFKIKPMLSLLHAGESLEMLSLSFWKLLATNLLLNLAVSSTTFLEFTDLRLIKFWFSLSSVLYAMRSFHFCISSSLAVSLVQLENSSSYIKPIGVITSNLSCCAVKLWSKSFIWSNQLVMQTFILGFTQPLCWGFSFMFLFSIPFSSKLVMLWISL